MFIKVLNIEQKILSFFNDDKPIKISELVTKTDMDIKYLNVYRDRLIKKVLFFRLNMDFRIEIAKILWIFKN